MSRVPGVEWVPDTPLERRARIALWAVLAASWVVAVLYMWDALTTTPPAERLEESTLVAIPTSRTFVAAVIFSGMELGVVLVALWPWRPSFYASRMGLAGMGIVTWFIMTTPMDLSRMDWVHRRWLAFMAVVVTAGLLTVLANRLRGLAVDRRATAHHPGTGD